MPDDYATWNTASQATMAAAQSYASATQNRNTRKWNERMHNIQREEALRDWNMQNAYNHPSAQMARLREAGLNPNLIYGKGAGDMTSTPIRSADYQNFRPNPPDFSGLERAALGYMDTKMKEAQIDNLRAQNTVAVQDAALRAAQVQNIGIKNQADLTNLEGIKKYSVEAMRLDNVKTRADIDLATQHATSSMDANDRANALQQPTLELAAQSVLNSIKSNAKTDAEIRHINQAIENMKKDGTLKDQDINLKKEGVQPHDAIYWRVLTQQLKKYGIILK